MLRPGDQRLRGGVGVEMLLLDVRVFLAHLVEHAPEERHRGQHVRLVDAGDAPDAVGGSAVPPRGDIERSPRRPFDALARNQQRVRRRRVGLHPFPSREVEPLGVLAHDNVVDLARLGLERSGNAGQQPHGPHVGVRVEPDAEHAAEHARLGAVGQPHAGQAHRPLHRGVRRPDGRERFLREVEARLPVERGAPAVKLDVEAERPQRLFDGAERRERCADQLRADAVAFDNNHLVRARACRIGHHRLRLQNAPIVGGKRGVGQSPAPRGVQSPSPAAGARCSTTPSSRRSNCRPPTSSAAPARCSSTTSTSPSPSITSPPTTAIPSPRPTTPPTTSSAPKSPGASPSTAS